MASKRAGGGRIALAVGGLAHVNARVLSVGVVDVQRNVAKVVSRLVAGAAWQRLAVYKPF